MSATWRKDYEELFYNHRKKLSYKALNKLFDSIQSDQQSSKEEKAVFALDLLTMKNEVNFIFVLVFVASIDRDIFCERLPARIFST